MADSYRLMTRLLSALTVLLIVLLFAAAKHWIEPALGSLATLLLPFAILTVCWSGLKTRALALADREKESGRGMIVAIAAQLGRQDDATLQQIQSRGGPAGEAAKMMLAERGRRAGRTGN